MGSCFLPLLLRASFLTTTTLVMMIVVIKVGSSILIALAMFGLGGSAIIARQGLMIEMLVFGELGYINGLPELVTCWSDSHSHPILFSKMELAKLFQVANVVGSEFAQKCQQVAVQELVKKKEVGMQSRSAGIKGFAAQGQGCAGRGQ
ncbi:uncharacterized protein UTRI_04925 [Ustilago trichophora]|uniref:Uncharacterized protein n=1 Tax=Ustilago trichophora TaxID=86804 RepID=A0A5C3EDK1_9BASI|nr:uncharacterized protein UTRI_04925 [Ustilago trichophora]